MDPNAPAFEVGEIFFTMRVDDQSLLGSSKTRTGSSVGESVPAEIWKGHRFESYSVPCHVILHDMDLKRTRV